MGKTFSRGKDIFACGGGGVSSGGGREGVVSRSRPFPFLSRAKEEGLWGLAPNPILHVVLLLLLLFFFGGGGGGGKKQLRVSLSLHTYT